MQRFPFYSSKQHMTSQKAYVFKLLLSALIIKNIGISKN